MPWWSLSRPRAIKAVVVTGSEAAGATPAEPEDAPPSSLDALATGVSASSLSGGAEELRNYDPLAVEISQSVTTPSATDAKAARRRRFSAPHIGRAPSRVWGMTSSAANSEPEELRAQLAVLRGELEELEAQWAEESTSLLLQLQRKDELLFSFMTSSMDERRAATPDPPDAGGGSSAIRARLETRMSDSRRIALAAEASAVEQQRQRQQQQQQHQQPKPPPTAAVLARATSGDAHPSLRHGESDVSLASSSDLAAAAAGGGGGREIYASVERVTEEGLATFEAELKGLTMAAAAAHQRAAAQGIGGGGAANGGGRAPPSGVIEGFKAEDNVWSYTSSCADGALWARGDAEQCLLKGYVHCPGVRANALFDVLLQVALRLSLALPSTTPRPPLYSPLTSACGCSPRPSRACCRTRSARCGSTSSRAAPTRRRGSKTTASSRRARPRARAGPRPPKTRRRPTTSTSSGGCCSTSPSRARRAR